MTEISFSDKFEPKFIPALRHRPRDHNHGRAQTRGQAKERTRLKTRKTFLAGV